MWRQGFFSASRQLYGMEHAPVSDFMPDFAYHDRGASINGRYDFLLNDKLAFHLMLQGITDHVPAVLRCCTVGCFGPFHS